MSKFEGSKSRVRCTDCIKLSGTNCTVKSAKVAPKKRRMCKVYEFKGEYENRIPAESIYLPPVDKKTRKLIQRLLNMGIIPVADDGSVRFKDGFAHTKTLPMPSTTATASLVGVKAQEEPLIYKPSDESPDSKLIWTPNAGHNDESDDNRG